MNLAKSYDFFRPETCQERIHIIGCGSVGSTVVENLARFGLTKFALYDFDAVEPHNIANQMFTQNDIGKEKIRAVAEMMCNINPKVGNDLQLFDKGYIGQKLSGYVFLCVDNIDLRRKIATENITNRFIKAMFDFRTRLTDAQHYAADWHDFASVDAFIKSMEFSHEEAAKETPMSACKVTLSVCPTVRIICAAGVSNFINFAKGEPLHKMILTDAFSFSLDAIG